MQPVNATPANNRYVFGAKDAGKLIATVGILFLCIGQAMAQPSITGKWFDVNHKDKRVELYAGSNGKINGKDEKNKVVFKDLTYDSSSKTYKGILINPDGGEELKITLTPLDKNRFSFTVKKFVFTRKFTFERLPETK